MSKILFTATVLGFSVVLPCLAGGCASGGGKGTYGLVGENHPAVVVNPPRPAGGGVQAVPEWTKQIGSD